MLPALSFGREAVGFARKLPNVALLRCLGLLRPAGKPRAHLLTERIQSRAFAGDFELGVAFECGAHHVAAERHFGVVGFLHQRRQAREQRTQLVDVGEIALRFRQIEAGR